MCRRTFLRMILFAVLAAPGASRAEDWPQWLGPQRDGVWRETGLLQSFPKSGLTVRWRVPINGGYAGPTVAAGRVYVTDYTRKPEVERPRDPFKHITQPGTERVLCIDQPTGKVLWTYAYDVAYSMSYSAGPRTAPAFDHAADGDRVYTLGGEGDLVCLDAGTGKLIWSNHLSSAATPTPNWGFASNPLIDGDKVICVAPGRDPEHGHGVATAFDKRSGAVLWNALAAKEPGYCSPVIYSVNGVRELIIFDPISINALDPETGKVYWSIPWGPARVALTVMTPRFHHDEKLGDLLILSTQYEGTMVVKLAVDPQSHAPSAQILWKRTGKSDRNKDSLHVVFAPLTVRGGHIYGVETYGELRCLDLSNGNLVWSTADATTYDAGPQKWASAFLIPLGDAGSRFLIANEHGDLVLADLDATGYHEVSRTHLLEPTNTDPQRPVVWCHPALAGGCIFWRNDKEMVCASMSADELRE